MDVCIIVLSYNDIIGVNALDLQYHKNAKWRDRTCIFAPLHISNAYFGLRRYPTYSLYISFNRHRDIDYSVIFKTNEEMVDSWLNVVGFYSYDLNTQINNLFFHQYSMFLVLLSLLRLSGIIWTKWQTE